MLHSFRRYLACALYASGATERDILDLLRWKSSESLQVYVDIPERRYAELLVNAARADVTTVRARNLPRTDALDVAAADIRHEKAVDAEAARAQAVRED